MKLLKKDYPFNIIVEDKIGKTSGKMYQSISLGHTVVANKDATDPKEKYKTEWFGFFDEKDLLKLSQLCLSTYEAIREERDKSKSEQKTVNKEYESAGEVQDDDIPF